jgi:nicotinate-nucleotide adenylyltransferase
MRIGIYSGSFDPVHNGHITLAQQALAACELDRLIFLPEALPRGKEKVSSLLHRLRMLELATADVPAFSVIGLRSERFSIAETLPELEGLFPQAAFTLVVGSDLVNTFATRWDGFPKLLQQVGLAIGLRGDDTRQNIDAGMVRFPTARYIILDPAHYHVSSTGARGGIHDEHIPQKVASYITKHGLYL